MPAGTHKVMLRARGLSRLWIDGKVVVRTQPLTGLQWREPITPLPSLVRDGIRWPGYRQQEVIEDWSVEESRVQRVVLETVVGGKRTSADTGELLVAVELQGESQFRLLSHDTLEKYALPLSDQAIAPYAAELEESMRNLISIGVARWHNRKMRIGETTCRSTPQATQKLAGFSSV